jgi:hypothetical protein
MNEFVGPGKLFETEEEEEFAEYIEMMEWDPGIAGRA